MFVWNLGPVVGFIRQSVRITKRLNVMSVFECADTQRNKCTCDGVGQPIPSLIAHLICFSSQGQRPASSQDKDWAVMQMAVTTQS